MVSVDSAASGSFLHFHSATESLRARFSAFWSVSTTNFQLLQTFFAKLFFFSREMNCVQWIRATVGLVDLISSVFAVAIVSVVDWDTPAISPSCHHSYPKLALVWFALVEFTLASWALWNVWSYYRDFQHLDIDTGHLEYVVPKERIDYAHVFISFAFLIWMSVISSNCHSSMLGTAAYGLVVWAIVHPCLKLLAACSALLFDCVCQ